MEERASRGRWLTVIARRAAERDVQRQIRFNRLRAAVRRYSHPGRLAAKPRPGIIEEFVQGLLGSLVAFWGVGKALNYIVGADPLYTFALLGLAYSARAAYLKYRLSSDPGFRIRGCRCAGARAEDMAKVLQSRESAILGVPSAVLGAGLYALLLVLVYFRRADAVMALAAMAVCVSAYLSYVMVGRIRSLCGNCINVSALNVLILLHVWLSL